MNLKKDWLEITVSLALLVITLGFLPTLKAWWMTSSFMPSSLFIFAFLFILFTALVFKERAGDEREVAHRNLASRLGYLTGTMVLALGIVLEALHHRFDPWLVLTLIVMIAAKILTRLYASLRQ